MQRLDRRAGHNTGARAPARRRGDKRMGSSHTPRLVGMETRRGSTDVARSG